MPPGEKPGGFYFSGAIFTGKGVNPEMNVLLEVFKEKPVRFIRSEPKELWIPVNDVADAIGYDRDTLRQLINRNSDLFANMCSRSVILLEGVGSREVLCVNRDGLVAVLVKISAGRIKDINRRKAVIEFQRWAVETISKILAGEYHLETFYPWAERLREHLEAAKALIEVSGVKPGIAHAAAIAAAEREIGRPLDEYRKALPPAEHDTGHLNATDIGSRLGISGIAANQMLEAAGLIKKVGQGKKAVWRLTEKGKAYGEEFPFVRNGHSGYQIRWNENVFEALENVELPQPKSKRRKAAR